MGGRSLGSSASFFFAQLVAYVLQLALRWAQPHQPVRSLYTRLFFSLHSYTSKCLEFELLDCWCCFLHKEWIWTWFLLFFQFKDVVMKRKRWLWIDNNLSASKTWLVVDGLTPGPYMLDCNHSRLSLRLAGRHFTGRPTKKLAQCCGVATDCSSRFWRQGSIVCTFFFRGGHCTKIADARLEIMKLESLNLGNRSESLWWLTVLCPAFNIDTLTLFWPVFWHFCRLGWLFLALDLPHSVRKTLKRRGNTVKEFSVLREFEIWYNVDVDGWWRSASSPASNISDYVFVCQHQVALVSRSNVSVSGVAVAHGRRVNDEFDPFIIRSIEQSKEYSGESWFYVTNRR